MKYVIFSIFFPFFTVAWLAANLLHIPDHEEMPAPWELIEELKGNY